MTWATPYIERLKRGETVQFRPRGNSMHPRIESGQLVTVTPACAQPNGREADVGDVVLCRCAGKHWLHLVKAIDWQNDRYQIGNNRGHINGWTSRNNIFGVVTAR